MWPFKKSKKADSTDSTMGVEADTHSSYFTTTEQDDPLDPRGDGTLRPGGPIFDAMMRGEAVYGNRQDDGSWRMEHTPDSLYGEGPDIKEFPETDHTRG